jgi:hypothetical protein
MLLHYDDAAGVRDLHLGGRIRKSFDERGENVARRVVRKSVLRRYEFD